MILLSKNVKNIDSNVKKLFQDCFNSNKQGYNINNIFLSCLFEMSQNYGNHTDFYKDVLIHLSSGFNSGGFLWNDNFEIEYLYMLNFIKNGYVDNINHFNDCYNTYTFEQKNHYVNKRKFDCIKFYFNKTTGQVENDIQELIPNYYKEYRKNFKF